jgi:hypothetical protein
MIAWIAKLLLLIAVMIALVWIKYAFVSSSFKVVFNQFHFLKNVSFYNMFWPAQSWLATQKLTLALSPKTLTNVTSANVTELFPKVYEKIELYTFLFQFNNMMIVDDEFSAFYTNLLKADNCALIEDKAVKCDTQFARDIFTNSFRSSIAFSSLAFNKFNVVLNSSNQTDLYKAYRNSMIDLNAISYTSYQ